MAATENNVQLIDLDGLIKAKNKSLYRLLPKFIINYIKRIIHQDDINAFLTRHATKTGVDFANAVITDFNITVKVNNEEKIPEKGRYIFVANHPLGALESLIMISAIHKKHPNLYFIVNDILMYLRGLQNVFLPVNKVGKNSQDYIRKIDAAMESDAQLLIFPAGLCSRKVNGKIVDLEWKKSFISWAIKHKRDIVPIKIEGKNSNFFYNLSNFRKKIGIKANIEMIYLPDEMYKQMGNTISLTVGEIIPYTFFDKTKTPAEWAEYVKKQTYMINNH